MGGRYFLHIRRGTHTRSATKSETGRQADNLQRITDGCSQTIQTYNFDPVLSVPNRRS
jgi:hypothetical protein